MEAYMDTSDCSENNNPIDLSRRCDSVETRKTPSPYNSSSFTESSPSLLNDSPTTSARLSIKREIAEKDRSETPTNHYKSSMFMKRYRKSPTRYSTFTATKSDTPSPAESLHNRYVHEAMNQLPHGNDIDPYILHAVALQQKLQNIPATISASTSTPSSPETASSNQYPVLGRDGKLIRPFKAYPRDPIGIAATIPTSDGSMDRHSAEKFNAFRKQMLEQIHAANGGHPTITNPKMRRSTSKTFGDAVQSEESQPEMEFHRQQHQKQLQLEEQNQVNCQSDSSSGCGSSNKGPVKDNAYYERRRKNNAAAKKSRDRRRIKEDEIAIRAAFLERENMELKIELAATKRQLSQFVAT